MSPNRFDPRFVTLRVGDSVLVRNEDPGPTHDFVIDELAADSGPMDTGETYRFRFTRTGTFDFFCSYHDPLMSGTVTVNP